MISLRREKLLSTVRVSLREDLDGGVTTSHRPGIDPSRRSQLPSPSPREIGSSEHANCLYRDQHAQRQESTAPAPQQQVLSIRVNEAFRYRLEHLKKVHFLQTGESVSTSEVAKLLLESARDDRLEFVKLAAAPMKSLLNARRKLESGLPLSQTEWMLVAYYCQPGAEASQAICQFFGGSALGDTTSTTHAIR